MLTFSTWGDEVSDSNHTLDHPVTLQALYIFEHLQDKTEWARKLEEEGSELCIQWDGHGSPVLEVDYVVEIDLGSNSLGVMSDIRVRQANAGCETYRQDDICCNPYF